MIARLRVCGQETWHRNVVRATSDGRYLTLDLAAYPHRVFHWLEGRRADVLLCAAGTDVTAALREKSR